MSERATTRRRTPPGWPSAHAEDPELAPGTVVGRGRFVVGPLLGRGGMATVYRGHDRRLGREVALKVMLDADHHAARARRFEHEAGMLARLPVHPGLVRLLHAGRLPELAERPFLAAEPIGGPTLAFRLAADLRMPVRQAVALGSGLARALEAVHGVGVVHRDLTARNVMLRDASEAAGPIIVDFGVAAVLEPEAGAARMTRPDQRPGTVSAMAPEQFRGRAAHPAMDVYALGRLLYEMITAEDPHATVSHAQLLECHREGARVAPRLAGRGDVGTAELRDLVDACLDPEPRRRPTAEDVVAELTAIEAGIERGATVLPFLHAGERATRESSRIAHPMAAAGQRTGGRARGRAGGRADGRARRRWIAGVVIGLAGVLLGAAARPQAPREEPSPVPEPEHAAVAWPSTVVPASRVVSAAPPELSLERPREPPRARAPTSPARRSTVVPAASPPTPGHAVSCVDRRERARAAARRWAWPEVLEATSDPSCWPKPEERARLRVVAWIEQRRFDACVEEGAQVRDPEIIRLVERCRRRAPGTLEGAAP